jgi:hypothetical protein
MIELPKTVVKAETKNPRKLVIYSPPKAGKTTLLSELEGCLIVDLEDGAAYVDALKVSVTNLEELGQVGKQILENGKPYKYVAIDTITKLEEWAEKYATSKYKKSAQGKNFDRENQGLSVLTLPNGAGYLWLRIAMEELLSYIYTWADHIILVGHVRDKFLEKDGKEVQSKDLDLTGKLRNIVCSQADAIAYLHRENDNVIANFKTADEVICGVRCPHLLGQEVVLSEKNEDGTFTTSWDKIYI